MIELAILKTFDSETHKAGVQLVGSLTTYLDNINVASNIAPEAMIVGNYILIAIPEGNPRDACVIASWPEGSSAGEGGGDMLKSQYDVDQNGVVDKAEAPRAGTTFPATPDEGDMFYRTDLKHFYIATT